jgi:hypothetical protein
MAEESFITTFAFNPNENWILTFSLKTLHARRISDHTAQFRVISKWILMEETVIM